MYLTKLENFAITILKKFSLKNTRKQKKTYLKINVILTFGLLEFWLFLALIIIGYFWQRFVCQVIPVRLITRCDWRRCICRCNRHWGRKWWRISRKARIVTSAFVAYGRCRGYVLVQVRHFIFLFYIFFLQQFSLNF